MSTVAKVGCETFAVGFGGFEGLPARKGQDYVYSPEFMCFGHEWCLKLYPGGNYQTTHDGFISLFLQNNSAESIEAQASFIVKESLDKVTKFADLEKRTYHPPGAPAGNTWGAPNFCERSAVIQALQDGAFIVEVQIKQTGPSTLLSEFVPQNPLHDAILKKFMDDKSADVLFVVSSDLIEGGRKKKKRAKTSPSTFHAHRFIIEESAPALAEACKLTEGLDPVPIAGVRPEIFKHALYYAYGGEVDDEDMKENTKEILEAADRFGVTNLKLAAEACYVKATEITIDNVLDNLVYADAKNCALLKEYAMDFIVENGTEVMKKVSLKDVPEGLFGDLLAAVSRGKKDEAGKSGEDVHMMRVSELRRKLDEKGLNVDGSREAMIAALEGSP